MKIIRTSLASGKIRSMELEVTQYQLDSWRAGELLQNAFPQLNADEREFIKTGITPSEWEDLNGSE